MKDNAERESTVFDGKVGDSDSDAGAATTGRYTGDQVRELWHSEAAEHGQSPAASTAARFASSYRAALAKAMESVDLDKVESAIQCLAEARDNGQHIFVCGNGGSASTASHFACDIVKGASFN